MAAKVEVQLKSGTLLSWLRRKAQTLKKHSLYNNWEWATEIGRKQGQEGAEILQSHSPGPGVSRLVEGHEKRWGKGSRNIPVLKAKVIEYSRNKTVKKELSE